jgi:hypothetical protein
VAEWPIATAWQKMAVSGTGAPVWLFTTRPEMSPCVACPYADAASIAAAQAPLWNVANTFK